MRRVQEKTMKSKRDEPDDKYYYRLRRDAASFSVDLKKKKWCDMWHRHFDMEGFGALGWVHRRRHLSALLTALARARVELMNSGEPYQLFAVINKSDAGADAIFVHTKNPNGTEFPIVHAGTTIESLPPLLSGRIDLTKYRVIVQNSDGSSTYVVVPRS